MTRWRVPPDLVLAALTCGAAVGLGEVAARGYAAVSPRFARQVAAADPLSALVEPHGDLGFRQKPYSRYHYLNGTVATANALGYRGPTVTAPKPPGTFRIVLLGESTTHGWGVNDDQTIDAYMRRALAERYPTRRIEVVNLAFDGYDSYQLYQRLASDGLRLDPDVLIVHTGINDVRNARFSHLVDRDVRTLLFGETLRIERDAALHQMTFWAWCKHHSYLARLPGMVRGRLVEANAVPTNRTVTPNSEAADLFVLNLRRIADLAAGRGMPVVFSTPPSFIPVNFSAASVAARSYFIVDTGTTQRYRDLLANRMRGVVTQLRLEGRAVAYVHPQLPPQLFLDDCHPTAEGNQRVAMSFVGAVEPLIEGETASRERPLLQAARMR